jgi:hypothetical protein
MLSSVTKLVDKSFVVGFLLPALLAVFAALRVFGCAAWIADLCTIDKVNPFANLTYVALLVWVVAILLLSVNYVVYRILEGYMPPTKWLHGLYGWHMRRFRRWTAERSRFREEGNTHAASSYRIKLLAAYPTKEEHVLPTAFGNALRAFEVYSNELYGADAIPVWLRLSAVIPERFQALINDAKAQVDFFVNIAVLAALFALTSFCRLVIAGLGMRPVGWPADTAQLLFAGVLALVVVYTSYRWSIVQIGPWGNLVKSAFDLYLPALGTQLGYSLPATESRRREFWVGFTKLILYRRPFPDGWWTLSSAGSIEVDRPSAGEALQTESSDDNDAG